MSIETRRNLLHTMCPIMLIVALLFWGSAAAQTTSSVAQITDSSVGLPFPVESVRPSISGDGARIAFYSTADVIPGGNTDGNFEIFVFNVTSGTFTQLTQTVGGGNLRPAISSDGTRVAFESGHDLVPGANSDGSVEIFYYNLSTNTFSQITDSAGGDSSHFADINHDGTRIAFRSTQDLVSGQNVDGNAEIFLYDTTSNTFVQATNTAGAVHNELPRISADGTRIVFYSNGDLVPGGNPDGSDEVFLYNATLSALTQITDALVGSFSPHISADNNHVVFHSNGNLVPGGNADGNLEIFLYTISTSSFLQLTTTTTPTTDDGSYGPVISEDGTTIAFASFANINNGNPDHSNEIYRYDVLTGTLLQVTDTNPIPLFHAETVSINATGTHAAFDSYRNVTGNNGDTSGEIFLALFREPVIVAAPTLDLWGLATIALFLGVTGLHRLRMDRKIVG